MLLVDDDAGARRSIQLLLRAKGFDVRAYATGSALLADPSSGQARCFVTDYYMDDLDGIELLSRLRGMGWNGPAVLITADPSPDLHEHARARGFAAVVEKPFRDGLLVGTVTRLATEQPAA